MGSFFSNIQIHNDQHKEREQFIKSFCKHMEKRDFIVGTEEDANIFYILAFSENNGWVTLSSPEYEAGGECVRSDIQWFAESLKACCVSTSVVDSDFAILEMYNGTSAMADMVVVGDGSGYGFDDDTAFMGKQDCWEPLLTDNSTWEQLTEIWNGDNTFVEESLTEMAPLLGMDSNYIAMDYNDFDSTEEKDPNIFMLYFKKAEKNHPNITVLHPPAKTQKTLSAAFKQIFGEAVKPLGYKKIKGKQPYFVRVVEGGEIIHIITFRNEHMRFTGYKEFNILGGVATVYRQSIDLSKSPSDNLNWLIDNSTLFASSNPIDFDREFCKSIYTFSYEEDNAESMYDAVKYSLKLSEQIMLPIFDKATDLNACIDYFNKFRLSMHFFDEENFGNDNPNNYDDEGFLYIKTNNQDGIRKKWKQDFLI